MMMIFGSGSANELFKPRNGLILDQDVETKFDKHQLVFIPETPLPTEGPKGPSLSRG